VAESGPFSETTFNFFIKAGVFLLTKSYGIFSGQSSIFNRITKGETSNSGR